MHDNEKHENKEFLQKLYFAIRTFPLNLLSVLNLMNARFFKN